MSVFALFSLKTTVNRESKVPGKNALEHTPQTGSQESSVVWKAFVPIEWWLTEESVAVCEHPPEPKSVACRLPWCHLPLEQLGGGQ